MGGFYIWQDPEWPQMIWKNEELSAVLAEVNQLRGVLLGRISMFGFEGKLTSSKWYKINHCSQDTANRDLCDLVAKGVLECNGKGRNTSYQLLSF